MNKIELFTIPAPGNTITEKDVINRQLRITKDFKMYFPEMDSKLILIIEGSVYSSSFIYREGRSHIWKLGKEIVSKLNLQAGCKVLIKKHSSNNYELEVQEDDLYTPSGIKD